MQNKVTSFPKPRPPITNEKRPVDMSLLDDITLIILLCDVAYEVKARCHGMRGLSVSDHTHRLWSMPAVMRNITQVINYISIAVGK